MAKEQLNISAVTQYFHKFIDEMYKEYKAEKEQETMREKE